MRHTRLLRVPLPVVLLVCGGLLAAASAAAQDVRGPGPVPLQPPEWPRVAIDAHGATSGAPSQAGFYPPIAADAAIPSRGFGAALGAHTYLGRMGVARLGVGASAMVTRATLDDATAILVRVVSPQISFNFGTPLGWSYLSGGAGAASLRGRTGTGYAAASSASGALLALNVGGGARWFVTPHVAFSFDLRFHRIGRGRDGATTPATLGAATVGLSFR